MNILCFIELDEKGDLNDPLLYVKQSSQCLFFSYGKGKEIGLQLKWHEKGHSKNYLRTKKEDTLTSIQTNH